MHDTFSNIVTIIMSTGLYVSEIMHNLRRSCNYFLANTEYFGAVIDKYPPTYKEVWDSSIVLNICYNEVFNYNFLNFLQISTEIGP
jgi:hypothetical protein